MGQQNRRVCGCVKREQGREGMQKVPNANSWVNQGEDKGYTGIHFPIPSNLL